MAVEAVNSTSISNITSKILNQPWYSRGMNETSVAKVAVAAAASITSTYRFFRVKSNDRVTSLKLANTIGTGGVGRDNDIGLYGVDGGAVVDADFFVKAMTLAAERAVWTELLPGAAAGAVKVTPVNSEKRIWELLALTTDPGIEYDVTMTVNEANTTLAIDVALQMETVR